MQKNAHSLAAEENTPRISCKSAAAQIFQTKRGRISCEWPYGVMNGIPDRSYPGHYRSCGRDLDSLPH